MGCGAPHSPSDGSVRFSDGSAVESGSIEFRSLDDGAAYASRIGSDGSFKLTDNQGQPNFAPGEYEVVVVQIVLTEDLPAHLHEHGHTVARRYADYATSGLRFLNKTDRTEPIQIELAIDP